MSKVIQQIKVSELCNLYITGFNEETKELTFRTSYEPVYEQKEIAILDKNDFVRINLYHFHRSYLDKFISENGKA